ncbi:MAG: HEAT repeat domain-containing protein [Spirillospora sp.]
MNTGPAGGPSPGPDIAVTDDLRDEIRHPLVSLGGLNWTDPETRPLVLAAFIELVNGSARHYASVPGQDESRRETVRELLQQARTHPPDSEERDEILVRLLPDPSAPAWTDRHAVNIATDEALALLAAPDEAGAILGIETLGLLTALATTGRSDQIRTALADLRARRPDDPVVLSAMLRIYSGLSVRGLLDDATDHHDAFVLDLLDHENAKVRRAAAAAVTDMRGNTPPNPLAERLIRLIDQDPDPSVQAEAALSLATRAWPDAGHKPTTETLTRLLDHPDQIIRTHALTWAVRINRRGVLDRLLDELTTPDPPWEILALVEHMPGQILGGLPRRLHKRFTEALARLDENGWAARAEPGAFPDAEVRAQTLVDASEALQLMRPSA